ncbi:MAG: glutamine--fructose-6-phosphate transaminase (isomerizing) [Gammaproteobacteria bacterium]|nr:glutamine--fructose-6-phosphate transaminase (isomerizing) [Gammaproteobacteria bacterium]MCI0591613.1 glutamine--fructose-6-phosphate transaminase (isomerizing) [Gammaproteobacteria bacterium]
MCGIVGAVAQRDVALILLEGLKRLEYRGYDSAGVAILSRDDRLQRVRVAGKVKELEDALAREALYGSTGIAHTRWATHGKPSFSNAHPHVCRGEIALVHNGIIENHEELRAQQLALGYEFTSETDTEVVVNQVHHHATGGKDLLEAVMDTVAELDGAYALGVISRSEPQRLIAARRGSPLVIGVGIGEHFIASDVFALLPVTQRFVFLEDGDIADITRQAITIYDSKRNEIERPIRVSELTADAAEKSGFRHFMLKEIFSQPRAVAETLEGRIAEGRVVEEAFGPNAASVLDTIHSVHIVACGTSYHAGLIARYWMEAIAGLPCSVEVASEFRYRRLVVRPETLFVSISQSGETADTLAALREAKQRGYAHSLAICNVPESSLTRESELVVMTRAGPEIGVASTKAFTTQLVVLMLLVILLGRRHGLGVEDEHALVAQLESLPGKLNAVLELSDQIQTLAEQFANKHHTLYLGRGSLYPVAMEGALKLKEISYIHAEAYPAGELKHGPLALVDDDMPVVAVAPNNGLLEKLKSNLQEVRARGGRLYVFADPAAGVENSPGVQVLNVAPIEEPIAPVIYTVPLQLFAYHVAVLKGADIDQPRNLAKSVTVE